MTEEHLKEQLKAAPLPEPVGGYDAARERALARVRHHPKPRLRWGYSGLVRPLGATALVAGLALVAVFMWPEPPASADTLPNESQMAQFYDHHEANQAAYFEDVP